MLPELHSPRVRHTEPHPPANSNINNVLCERNGMGVVQMGGVRAFLYLMLFCHYSCCNSNIIIIIIDNNNNNIHAYTDTLF